MTWQIALRLFLICLVPAGVSIGMYFIQKKTKFGNIPYIWQQIIIGVIFGGCAIFGTEVGVDVGGAVANVRDAGPLCAGLIFGGPAGLIAGVIGGVGRALQPVIYNYTTGVYSWVACSVSTVIAGIYAFLLRKFMFDDKRPNWGFALAIGMIMEVIHLMMLFLTKLDDISGAFNIIEKLAIPMIVCNGISVFIPCLTLELIAKKENPTKGKYKKLTNQIQVWMLVGVVVTFAVSTVFVYFAESNTAYASADSLMQLNMNDVKNDVYDSSSKQLLSICAEAKEAFEADEEVDLDALVAALDISEIDIIETDGLKRPVITKSTDPGNIGYYMSSGKQSREFNILLKNYPGTVHKDEFVQEAMIRSNPVPGTFKDNIYKYAGMTLDLGADRDGYIQVAYNYTKYESIINAKIFGLSTNRHVGNTGRVIVADIDQKIVSSGNEAENLLHLKDIGYNLDNLNENTRYQTQAYFNSENMESTCFKYSTSEFYYVISAIPEAEIIHDRDANIYLTSFTQIIIFALLFAIIYMLIKHLVVNNINTVNKSLAKIIDGDLDVTLDVKGSDEFASLSDDINSTVDTLKRYIDEAAHRIDEELKFAKSIQMSALPNTYPAFPTVESIDILAKMVTAKEVGGDFYDYYLLDSHRIGFLIADVSGKGIPAAMFMMQSKATIKNFAVQYESTKDIMERANEELCKENDAGMFVTCWFGIIDINTGVISYTNAGHNPPLVYRSKTKSWEYLKGKCGFVLAGLDCSKYSQGEITLNKGDKLFLYTDGVTEATRNDKVLYGEDRLLEYLQSAKDLEIHKTLDGLKESIDTFIDGAPQFDDITMVMVEFKGKK